jgi:hypothetical protein
VFHSQSCKKSFGKNDEIKIYLNREFIHTFKLIFDSVSFSHIDIEAAIEKITIEWSLLLS